MKVKAPKTAGMKKMAVGKVDNSMKVKGKPKAVNKPAMKKGYASRKGKA